MPSFVCVTIILLGVHVYGDSIFQCKKEFHVCGDNHCCCIKSKAICDGKKSTISYIPRFANNVTYLKIVNNVLPNLTKSCFKNISDLKLRELFIEDDKVMNVSIDAFTNLHYLENLSIRGNKMNTSQLFEAIGSINRTELKVLILTTISLSGEIPRALLCALNGSSLIDLWLDKNGIKVVRDFVIAGNLELLDLSENTIIDFNPGSGHSSLHILNLSHNQITGVFPDFCANGTTAFPKLAYLNLDNNFISIITNDQIGCLKSLKQLKLSANVVGHIPGNLISNLPVLRDLRMNQMFGLGGHMVAINGKAFNSTSLQRLELGLNNIIFTEKYVETDIFQSCKELTYLNFQGNNMRKIRDWDIERIFSPLTKLKTLLLVANRLKSIPKHMLINMTNLRFLNLDGNGIQELGDSLHGPENLETLLVQGNNIRIVGPDSFPPNVLKTLRQLNLNGNPFACTCDNLWFRNWVGEEGKPKGTNITLDNWPRRYNCYTPREWNEKRFRKYRPTKASCSRKNFILVTSITFFSILFIVFISIPIGIRYRWHMMYAWYRLTKRTKDPERRPLLAGSSSEPYIYVIYNDDDRQFVHYTLCDIVEVDFGMKLFVWHRDADNGSMANTMFDAIDSCTNVIAVVSNAFVTDGWCEFQLDIGLSKKNTTRQDCLTLILLENLDVSLLRRSWCVTLVKNATVNWCSNAESVQGKLCVEKLKSRLSSM